MAIAQRSPEISRNTRFREEIQVATDSFIRFVLGGCCQLLESFSAPKSIQDRLRCSTLLFHQIGWRSGRRGEKNVARAKAQRLSEFRPVGIIIAGTFFCIWRQGRREFVLEPRL